MHDTLHPRRWWALGVLCLSLLVVTVDATIVNTALPTLARDLGADTTGLQWIVDAYTLAFAGLLLLSGALGDRYGRKRALTFGLVVFAASSTAAAFASSTGELVAMRAVMGVGAAFVMPATLGIVMTLFPEPAERVKALAAWSAVSGLGVAIGPTTSGFLLERFDWGSVFLVTLPLVAVALGLGRILIPGGWDRRSGRLDWPGALLSVAGLSLLTWTLIEAPRNGWLSATTIVASAGALTLVAAFLAWERRAPAPLMDLNLLRDRRVTAASAAVAVAFFALFGMLFVLTQVLQFVLGYTTLEAGLAALPFAAVLAIASPVGAALGGRLGARPLVTGGLLLIGTGLGFMSLADAGSGLWFYVGAMVPVAAGLGCVMAPATESVMSSVPAGKASMGAAMNNTTREVGGVLGVAIVGSVTASVYTTGIALAVAGLPSTQQAAADGSIAGATAIGTQIGGPDGLELVRSAQEAFTDAVGTGVLTAAAVAVAGAVVAWLCLPRREAPPLEA